MNADQTKGADVTNQTHVPFETKSVNGGEQKIYRFPNEFGASVIRHDYSYGHEAGLWELAVIKFEGGDWSLNYDTPVTDDVLGHLTDDEVTELLDQIAAITA
jgi:hypothetical protein